MDGEQPHVSTPYFVADKSDGLLHIYFLSRFIRHRWHRSLLSSGCKSPIDHVGWLDPRTTTLGRHLRSYGSSERPNTLLDHLLPGDPFNLATGGEFLSFNHLRSGSRASVWCHLEYRLTRAAFGRRLYAARSGAHDFLGHINSTLPGSATYSCVSNQFVEAESWQGGGTGLPNQYWRVWLSEPGRRTFAPWCKMGYVGDFSHRVEGFMHAFREEVIQRHMDDSMSHASFFSRPREDVQSRTRILASGRWSVLTSASRVRRRARQLTSCGSGSVHYKEAESPDILSVKPSSPPLQCQKSS